MKQTKCPNCQNKEVEDFFTIKNAPVQSVVTIKTYEEAIAIPKNDIVLSFCNHCGFIYNSAFDTDIDYYTKGYEDQQGFSPTFKRFITEVTTKFVDKYNVHEKNIVEIGCGKGDFLNLICEIGNCRGVGIDPAYEPGRSKPNPNVSFIKEFYSKEHRSLQKDVITCRHTLEHIHDTNEFVHTMRNSISKDEDVTVFIEVPSIVRILEVQAFWDIFNEHCSYFSPGSLCRLFKFNRFEILDAYIEYDNQYLFIEAKPTNEISTAIHPLEESVEDLKKSVDEFVVKINAQLNDWREMLMRMKEQNKKVVVWGGGSKAVGFLAQFNDLKIIEQVVDINPHMQGNYIPGIGIQYIDPDQLKEIKPDAVIIMNGIYKNEISQMLRDRGLQAELICL